MSIRTLSNAHLLRETYADNPRCDANHTDRIDCEGDRWVWCDECYGFRIGNRYGMHESGYGWGAVELDEAYGPLRFALR